MKSVKSAIGKAADGAANIYLLYFSKHAGNKIFVKWSASRSGPFEWITDPAGSEADSKNVVMFFKDFEYVSRKDGTTTEFTHMAMPDVHIAEDAERFVMIFHGEFLYHDGDMTQMVHKNFIASSDNMLNFNEGVLEAEYENGNRHPLVISQPYSRAFKHKGKYYGIGKKGQLYDIPDSFNFTTGELRKNKTQAPGHLTEDWDISTEIPSNLYLDSPISEYMYHRDDPVQDGSWVNHPFAVSYGEYVEVFFWVKNHDSYFEQYSVLLDPGNQWKVVSGSFRETLTRDDMKSLYGVSARQIGDPYLKMGYLYFAYSKSKKNHKAEGQIGIVKFEQSGSE